MFSKWAAFAPKADSIIDTRLLRRQGERCIGVANASFDVALRERQLEMAARYIGRAVELEGLSAAAQSGAAQSGAARSGSIG